MTYATKHSQRTGILTIVTVITLVFFVVVLLSKNGRTNSYLSNDPLLDRKDQILAMATPGKDLTPQVRAVLFHHLSGQKLGQYNFTAEEKSQIVNFLNGKK